jgi:hypothetical protein
VTAKPRHPVKPSFNQFFEALKGAVAKPPKAGLPDIRRILNVGFADVGTSQLIMQVAEALGAYTAADRWAVSAATREATGKLNRFQQQVLAEVRSHFARQIGFFELDLTRPNFKQEIEKWLRCSAPRRGAGPVQIAPTDEGTSAEPSAVPAPRELPYDSWLRWSFVCVLSTSSSEKRMEGALTLIEFWAGRAKENSKASQPEPELYRFIANVLGAEKPKRSRMAPVLNGLYALKGQLAGALRREGELDRDLGAARGELADLKLAETEVRGKLTDAQTAIEAQGAEIGKLKQNLSDAENRYQLLDEHWKRSSATSLARKIGTLTEELGHEVREAILSLDRESPNLIMGLNRLRRLQSIIQRQVGRDEETGQ